MCNIKENVILFFGLMLVVNISFAYVTKYQPDQESEQQNDFVVGQVWSYETRQHEQKSKLIILKVDYFEDAVVVHIRLENLKLLDSDALHGIRTIVPHMAILQTALQKSVVKLLDKNKRVPEFSKDYQSWREGDGIGSAWAWHYSVSKALNGLERIYGNEQQSTSIKNNQDSNN